VTLCVECQHGRQEEQHNRVTGTKVTHRVHSGPFFGSYKSYGTPLTSPETINSAERGSKSAKLLRDRPPNTPGSPGTDVKAQIPVIHVVGLLKTLAGTGDPLSIPVSAFESFATRLTGAAHPAPGYGGRIGMSGSFGSGNDVGCGRRSIRCTSSSASLFISAVL
jgi:hypothetical protein